MHGRLGLQGLVRLRLDGLGLEGLLGGRKEVWLVVLGWSHGVLARNWHHWLLGDHGLLSWHHGDVVMRLEGVTRGVLLGQHGNDLVVQPSTHGFVTIGSVLVRNKEAGLPLAPGFRKLENSKDFSVLVTI